MGTIDKPDDTGSGLDDGDGNQPCGNVSDHSKRRGGCQHDRLRDGTSPSHPPRRRPSLRGQPAAVLNTALGYIQLNATANTAGTFVYNPPLGTVLNVAGPKTLSVTFNPTDTVRYSTVAKSVQINVVAPGADHDVDPDSIDPVGSVQRRGELQRVSHIKPRWTGAGREVAFKIGTRRSVWQTWRRSAMWQQYTYQAVWSGPLLEPSPGGTPPTGQMRPSLRCSAP
jgi:hypothetical protein